MTVLSRALATLLRRRSAAPSDAPSSDAPSSDAPSGAGTPREVGHTGMTPPSARMAAPRGAASHPPFDPEDAFVLASSFLDAPYTVIAGIDPAEEVIVVQYSTDAEPPEIRVTLASKGPGDAVELSLNGRPRALVQKARGLTEAHVRTMDVSRIEG